MFLPGNRGFDEYLGVPYSDDMGGARATPCSPSNEGKSTNTQTTTSSYQNHAWFEDYCAAGFCEDKLKKQLRRLGENDVEKICHHSTDPAGCFLPLVYQNRLGNGVLNTTVLEQPLDFTHLGKKYSDFVTGFINRHAADPFFLYVP